MNWTYAAVAAAAYLLGSIPFGYILVRFFRKQDIRSFGSGNIGATNVARSGSKGLGILTLFLDALKGYLAIIAAQHIIPLHHVEKTLQQNGAIIHIISFPDLSLGIALAAVAAILGHVFPVWLGFKGGKGVATGLGVFLAIAPQAVGLAVLLFALLFFGFRYVSLASIVSAAVFPILAMMLYRNTMTRPLAFAMWIVSFVIIAKHHSNIARLLKGEEPKFGSSKSDTASSRSGRREREA
jgi:acyl phosphate:glycerol-3-phosphate acyltransferase